MSTPNRRGLEAKRESDELRDEAAKQARQTVHGADERASQLIAEATRQREAIETVIGDLAQERDAVVAKVRKLAEHLEETAGGVAREAAVSGSITTSEDSEPPEEEAITRTAPVAAVEDLSAEPTPLRRRNGSPAV
ncbi:MAG: hypothetical protein WD810_07415 [Solirubrobacterales bacterium]